MSDFWNTVEDRCQRCRGKNVSSWFVDSDRFNLAVTALGLDSGAIICPGCFVEGHEAATGSLTTWKLLPAEPFIHDPSR